MVSGEVQPVPGHQELCGLERQQRPEKAVTQVNDRINAAPAHIFDHGLKCGQIPMDVCNNGDSHRFPFAASNPG